jgi:hypothetical protein
MRRQTVVESAKDDDGNRTALQTLLVSDVGIAGEQDVELVRRSIEQPPFRSSAQPIS